jgi:uncharacterized protein (UPF0332 family)
MTFNPSEFLRVANELALNTDDEASLRSAVSRAYYAVFLQARDCLGLHGHRRTIHGQVIGRLKSADRNAGDQLDKLEVLRGEADYELEVQDPLHRNWRSNWAIASSYAMYISRRLQRL